MIFIEVGENNLSRENQPTPHERPLKRSAYAALPLIIILAAFVPAPAQVPFLAPESTRPDPGASKAMLTKSAHRPVLNLSETWKAEIDGDVRDAPVPGCYDFDGEVIYRRTFTPDITFSGKHLKLLVNGINHKCEIKINDTFVTNHIGGFAAFEVDLTHTLVRVGQENSIEIIVDSRLDLENSIPLDARIDIPLRYGGIVREVFLTGTSDISIETVSFKSALSESFERADLSLSFELRDQASTTDEGRIDSTEVLYLIDIFSEDSSEPVFSNHRTGEKKSKSKKKKTVTPQIRVAGRARLQAAFSIENPLLWSPVSPNRYRAEISIVTPDSTLMDDYVFHFGLRSIRIDGHQILLNGSPLILKGVQYITDFAKSGNAIDLAQLNADLMQVKSMGANAILFPNHPISETLLNLCDRFGILCIEELPLYSIPNSKLTSKYLERFKPYVEKLVTRHRGHPSLFAWSLGSDLEFPDMNAAAFLEELNKTIKKLDDRPTLIRSRFPDASAFPDFVDIRGLNIYAAEYHQFADLVTAWSTQDKPQFITSYGVEIFPDNQDGSDNFTSTRYQAKYLADCYRKILSINEDNPGRISGSFVNAFADFRKERPILTGDPNQPPNISAVGLFDINRNPRFAFDIVRNLYNENEVPPIPPGPNNVSRVVEYYYPSVGFALILVFVIFFRQNLKFNKEVIRSLTKPHGFFVDIRDQRILSVSSAVLTGFFSSVSMGAILSAFLYSNRRNGLADHVLDLMLPSDFLKSWIDGIIWQPLAFIGYFTALFLLAFVFLGLLIKLLNVFFRHKTSFKQATAFAFWSASHFLILLPVSVIFYKLIGIELLNLPLLAFFVVMLLWHFSRVIKAMKVAYDSYTLKVYLVFGGFLALVGTSLFIYYNLSQSIWDYLNYVRDIYESGNYLN